MNSTKFHAQILELIRRTSAFLPADVSNVIEMHRAFEQAGSRAELALSLVSQNIGLTKRLSAPICRDTGTITFYVKTPVGFDQLELEEVCKDAIAEATAKGYLRQNSVDSVTGKNTGNNLGPGSPVFHWHQHGKDTVDIRLILKGGSCENMSAQYSNCRLRAVGQWDFLTEASKQAFSWDQAGSPGSAFAKLRRQTRPCLLVRGFLRGRKNMLPSEAFHSLSALN
jgi:fumarate hydratase, class I